MRYEVLYLIRPADVLRERLSQAGQGIAEFLDRPLLWTKKEGGVTAWTEEDTVAQVKLLFLLDLWSEYVIGVAEDGSLKAFLEELLGCPPFDERAFDHWWRIERFDGADQSFEEIEESLTLEQPQLLVSSALPRVEAWLSRFEKRVHA